MGEPPDLSKRLVEVRQLRTELDALLHRLPVLKIAVVEKYGCKSALSHSLELQIWRQSSNEAQELSQDTVTRADLDAQDCCFLL